MAASTYRATQLRTITGSSKPIRNVTPFGIIRNQSPLGNGVSVIRVSMALEVGGRRHSGSTRGSDREGEDVGEDNVMTTLLNRLNLEEKELYTKISMLANQQYLFPSEASPDKGMGTYNLKQKALVDYVSNGEQGRVYANYLPSLIVSLTLDYYFLRFGPLMILCFTVASIFLPYQKYIRYGSLDSVRVPFVEDAVREFRQVAKDDRVRYNSIRQQLIQKEQHYEQKQVRATMNEGDETSFIVATILLAIKGDRTTVPLPMLGVLRQRDMARALLRIAIDAKVQDCLIASEIMVVPDMQICSIVGGDRKEEGKNNEQPHGRNDMMRLLEEDVLASYPNLIRLT
jgi:hypothetical protein